MVLKLNNPETSAKAYKSVLKTLYNSKKITAIPALLVNNELISDFKTKENHFSSVFASHCTPLDNKSKVPGRQTYITDRKLSSLQFEDNGIIKIIRSLNTNKANGHDDTSIRMLCDLVIIKPLPIRIRNCINHSAFPDSWKKSNIYTIHKIGDKKVINNYRPVSLLPICGKIFERLIFNSLFEKYKLLSAHQSGFGANDSCVAQLLSIFIIFIHPLKHTQLLNLVEYFLDISKNFDKVWHEGSFLNLNQWIFQMPY